MEKLDNICGDSLYCDVTELEAICGDLLDNQHVLTNQVSRGKRSIITKAVSLSSITGNNTRQMIDIIFKIVGTSKAKFVARSEQIEFGQKISEIKHSMKNSSSSGELG